MLKAAWSNLNSQCSGKFEAKFLKTRALSSLERPFRRQLRPLRVGLKRIVVSSYAASLILFCFSDGVSLLTGVSNFMTDSSLMMQLLPRDLGEAVWFSWSSSILSAVSRDF